MRAAMPPLPTEDGSAPAQGGQRMPLAGPLLIDSADDFDATIMRLDGAVAAHGLKVFAVIDHAGGAGPRGAPAGASRQLVFGDPKAMAAFAQVNPAFGYELPIRVLVFEQAGRTRLAVPDLAGMADAYGIGAGEAPLKEIIATLDAIVQSATGITGGEPTASAVR